MGLRAAEPAVRADLVLERGDLLELGVVAAVDHQVGDRAVAVDLGDLLARARAERLERVVADDLAGRQVDGCRCAPSTTDGPAAVRTSTKPISGCAARPAISRG